MFPPPRRRWQGTIDLHCGRLSPPHATFRTCRPENYPQVFISRFGGIAESVFCERHRVLLAFSTLNRGRACSKRGHLDPTPPRGPIRFHDAHARATLPFL